MNNHFLVLQEIEAADMLRGKMQQGYKEQLHEQQGIVAELRQENRYLMEVSCDAALLELVELCHPPMSAKFHSVLSPFYSVLSTVLASVNKH